ncbi:MAG: nucleotide exchange factor GrpE [Aestuariivita sp.]|nr:nucleotide exchange factor GrpE [Aestuariivita sp.]
MLTESSDEEVDLTDSEIEQVEEEKSEIDILRDERDELKDKFMRALAEAENARKRSDKARREAEKYGGSRFIRDMLPVYDNLNRALNATNDKRGEDEKGLIDGIELTLREFSNVFKKHGIEFIRPEVGDKFDPTLHEAMFEAPVPDTKAGEIIEISADGVMLYDRLLRPAQVGVSSNTG